MGNPETYIEDNKFPHRPPAACVNFSSIIMNNISFVLARFPGIKPNSLMCSFHHKPHWQMEILRLMEVKWESPVYTCSSSGSMLLSLIGRKNISLCYLYIFFLSLIILNSPFSQIRSLKSKTFYYGKCQIIQKQYNGIMIPQIPIT